MRRGGVLQSGYSTCGCSCRKYTCRMHPVHGSSDTVLTTDWTKGPRIIKAEQCFNATKMRQSIGHAFAIEPTQHTDQGRNGGAPRGYQVLIHNINVHGVLSSTCSDWHPGAAASAGTLNGTGSEPKRRPVTPFQIRPGRRQNINKPMATHILARKQAVLEPIIAKKQGLCHIPPEPIPLQKQKLE
jgi:hypothetical protein